MSGHLVQSLVHGPIFAPDESPIQNHFGIFVQRFFPAAVHGASHEAVDQHVGPFELGLETNYFEVGLSHPFVSSGHGMCWKAMKRAPGMRKIVWSGHIVLAIRFVLEGIERLLYPNLRSSVDHHRHKQPSLHDHMHHCKSIYRDLVL